jgi:hypothetical protein
MADHAAKIAYAVALGISEIVRTSQSPILATFTFKENVTDMHEAKRRWHCLRERIKRRYGRVRGVGVWQRQERGAWHFHCVLDRFFDIGWLREAALATGFGTFVDLKFIRPRNGFNFIGGKAVAQYLTRYMVRDLSDGNQGERLVTYLGDGRVGSSRFGWARGMALLYRLGRPLYFELFQRIPRFEEYWLIVRIGWESLDSLVQCAMLERYRGVRKWWYGDQDPDPF